VETLGAEAVDVACEEFVIVVKIVVVEVVVDPLISVLLELLDVGCELLLDIVELTEVVLLVLEVEPVVDEFD